ncbi:hypothetical protein [Vibrio ulleungensis]|uniref:Peptidase MA-like domain-containing protein n=1 Tax=Vibrio ulleungensis TaxID=2807619 RepID=A0ABS2HHW7_9VIBR|nr:hypothetical protein [Vibrio ulleungensis]MBM7037130.1 hypothetical protein [Vibrio ulleungensis]
MKKGLILFTASTLSPLVLASTLVYEAKQADGNPRLKLSVDTSEIETFEVMKPRNLTEAEPPKFVCYNGEQVVEGAYNQSLTCDTLSWELPFLQTDPLGFNIAEQTNQYSAEKGWFFFSEWSSLPRVQTDQGITESKLCVPGVLENCYDLPTLDQAPLLLMWGIDSIVISEQNYRFELRSDVSAVIDNQAQWLPTFKQQLNYLSQVFSAPQEINWQMNVFGREMETGNVSGAAGYSSINVNVPLKDGALVDASYPHLLKILAHEAIHGLDTRAHPLWITEGLAEYYAQKSLKQTPFALPDAKIQWQAIAQRLPFAATGLLQANRDLVELNQQHYQMLFYTKAVAFWQQLDEELSAAGQSLDTYMTQPLAGEDYQLSTEFTQAVISAIGAEKWAQLTEVYL